MPTDNESWIASGNPPPFFLVTFQKRLEVIRSVCVCVCVCVVMKGLGEPNEAKVQVVQCPSEVWSQSKVYR